MIHACILFFVAVGSIDTSGISMLKEAKKVVERRGLQVIIPHSLIGTKFDFPFIYLTLIFIFLLHLKIYICLNSSS